MSNVHTRSLCICATTEQFLILHLVDVFPFLLVTNSYVVHFQVLCRTQEMSEETYKELLEHATNEGYDVSKLHKTEQIPGVGESEGEDTDRAGVWWVKSLFGK